MRIFQAIDFSTNVNVQSNQTWVRNLYEPLLDLGNEVFLVSTQEVRLTNLDSVKRDRFSTKLLETFIKEHAVKPFQLLFTYLMDGMIDPMVIEEIRRHGVITCNFSCNNAHQFYLVDEISPHFDFNLHTEKDARQKFLAIGANPLWWPMASNPKYFHPQKVQRTIPVSFVGENYALRAKYIGYLLEHGVEVHAFGPRWKYGTTSRWRSWAKRIKYIMLSSLSTSLSAQMRASANLADHDYRRYLADRFPENVHSPLADEDLISLYSLSHISLGFLEVYLHHDAGQDVVRHIHLREFEAPMSGALYCTGYSEELCEFFDPEKEILTYHNQFELLDKVNYYLAHPQEGDLIRQAGYSRALRDHTYQRRFKQLFQALGLP